MKLFVLLVVGILLAGCAGLGVEYRDRVSDRVADRWCALTETEKEVVAHHREYSDEFVAYLESRCD